MATAEENAEPELTNVKTWPLVRFSDMPEETKPEIVDLVTGAIDRYTDDLEMACQEIQRVMERSYGEGWLVVVGEAFSFEITYQLQHVLFMFYMGNLGILVWKCT